MYFFGSIASYIHAREQSNNALLQSIRGTMSTFNNDQQLPASFIAHIKQYPLLNAEEERAALLQTKSDNAHIAKSARDLLVNSNLRLVIKIARGFENRNLLDAIQSGNVGLCEAIKHFDITNESRFASYAPTWIKSAILKEIMRGSKIVVIGKTATQRKLFYQLRKVKSRIETLEGYCTPAMIAETLGVKVSEVEDMLLRMQNESGYDVPQGNEGRTLQETIADQNDTPEERQEREQIINMVRNSITGLELNEFERAILKQRLLTDDKKTLEQIAKPFNISRERIRQYEAGLLERIKRKIIGSQVMKEKTVTAFK